MVELNDNLRMGMLIGAAAILIFTIVNMTGLIFDGEKLFIIDLIMDNSEWGAFRTDTGFSTQDIVLVLVSGIMAALYFVTAEEELDWEALLGDDDEEE